MNGRQIIMVKKVLPDGQSCRKCRQVLHRMEEEGLLPLVDRIVAADPRFPDNEGMRLAFAHRATRAPFFIVREENGRERVFDCFAHFRDTLRPPASGAAVDSPAPLEQTP